MMSFVIQSKKPPKAYLVIMKGIMYKNGNILSLKLEKQQSNEVIKKNNLANEINIMDKLNVLMTKDNLSEEEEITLKKLKEEIEKYVY